MIDMQVEELIEIINEDKDDGPPTNFFMNLGTV